jgi:glucan-binding YG repeat protein
MMRSREKGSVTLFVLVSMLIFITVLMLGYSNYMNKSSNQKMQIKEIEKEYDVNDEEMEEIYYEIEEKLPVSITLYKPTGEVYNVEEWTNQDLTLEIFYPGRIEDDYKYYYLDDVEKKYREGEKITENGKIRVEHKGNRVEKVVSRIDKVEPVVTIVPNGGNVYVMPTTEKATIRASLEAEDFNKTGSMPSGLEILEYAWSTSNTEEPSDWTDFTNGEEIIKGDCEPGTYYLWTRVIDKAGNRAENTKVSNGFVVNGLEVETGQIKLIPSITEWTNQDVMVRVEYGANLTQNRKVTCTGTNNVDYSVNGTESVEVKTNEKAVTAEATDIAGNKVTKTIMISNIDKENPTKPLVEAYYDQDKKVYNGEWTNKAVYTKLSSIDELSGVKEIQYSKNKTDWTKFLLVRNPIKEEGTKYSGEEDWTLKNRNDTYYIRAMDKAGNISEASEAFTVKYDVTAPTVTLSPNGGTAYTMPSSGKATIKTTLTAADTGGSGLNTLQYAWSTSNTTEPTSWTNFTSGSSVSKTDIASAGTYYLWTKVIDGAGNRATSVKVSNAFKVNANTATSSQITLSPSTTAWTNGNVTVTATYGGNLTGNKTLTCTGTATTDYTINGTSNVVVKTNGKTVTATATDVAGNRVTKTLTISNIDKVLPTVTLSPNGGTAYTMSSSGTATIRTTLTAADTGGSGLNALQYAWSTSNSVEPTAWTTFSNGGTVSKTNCTGTNYYLWTKVTDKAGNRARISVSNAFSVYSVSLYAGPTKIDYEKSESVNYSGIRIALSNNIEGNKIIDGKTYVTGCTTNTDDTYYIRHTITVSYSGYTWTIYTYKKGWYGVAGGNFYYWENHQKVVGEKQISYIDSSGKNYRNDYYFKESGLMHTGWRSVNGKWIYYLETEYNTNLPTCNNANDIIKLGYPRGSKLKDRWIEIKETGGGTFHWYHLDSNGYMQTGWYLESGSWYYLKPEGFTGWSGPTGSMLKNTSANIGGKVYNFNASGVCTNP